MSTLDADAVSAFALRTGAILSGAALSFAIWLGDELGLYRALRDESAVGVDQLAGAVGCNPSLVREWLDSQAAAGFVSYDEQTDQYELSPEAALVLADEDSPVFLARAMNTAAALFLDGEKIVAAFRDDGGLPAGDRNERCGLGFEWANRSTYRNNLHRWVRTLADVDATLRGGGSIADIGCGNGAATIALALAYPDATVQGFDLDERAVATGRLRAARAGAGDHVAFDVADATGYSGSYDLVCFSQSLHEMGDPVAAVRHAREHVSPQGAVLVVEPAARTDRRHNVAENPIAALAYVGSAALSTPVALAQPGRSPIGTQAGVPRLQEIATDAGFTTCRLVEETMLNLVLELRP